MEELHRRTIERAAELQGDARLAELLGVSVDQLQRWVNGNEPVPAEVFLRAARVMAEALQRP